MPFLAAIPPALAAIIGGGTAAAGSLAAAKMGSNANKSIAKQQLEFARQQQLRSQPAFDTAYNYYNSILKGGPEMQASLAPALNNINAQYDQAYKNILDSSHTRGGSLDKALRQVQTGRAFTLSDLYGSAQQNALQGLVGLAGGDATRAAQVFGDAQQSQINDSQMRMAALQGVGSLFTRLLTNPNLFKSNAPSGGTGYISASSGTGRPPAALQSLITPAPMSINYANPNGNPFAGMNFNTLNSGRPTNQFYSGGRFF